MRAKVDAARKWQTKQCGNNGFRISDEGRKWHNFEEEKLQTESVRIMNRGRMQTVSVKQRDDILRRDNYTCQKCGRYAIVEVDHKIPFSLGGSDANDNLWTLCERCNRGKSNRYTD